MTDFKSRYLDLLIIASALLMICLSTDLHAQQALSSGAKKAREGITAEYKGSVDSHVEEDQQEDEPVLSKTKPKTKPSSSVGRNLTLSYSRSEDPQHRKIAAELKDSGRFEALIEDVNDNFDFPKIQVVFESCDEANAYYFAEDRKITICYELVTALTEAFGEYEDATEESVEQQVTGSLVFTFFHELGHAAVDVFDLPITGNEEDAVDRFATLVLIESSDDDDDLADSAIGSFDLEVAESLDDLDFADEHPVDEQRWYTMACLMVGSDPGKYSYLVGEDGLPEERAEACPAEYEKISRSWETLMKPHLKE